jgi:hypothetical protein
LWDRWVGDHPQEDLAKFGYRTNSSCILAIEPIV